MPFDNPPFTPESSPEIELLRVARANIEETWSKNWYACAVVAIGVAANNPHRGRRRPTKIEKRVARLLAHELPLAHRCRWFFCNARGLVITYNDSKPVTRMMMLGLFDLTIQRLEQKQHALCFR